MRHPHDPEMPHVEPLTPALQRWLEHVRAAEARGLTLKAHAAGQGLAVDPLYAGKAKLKRKGLLPGREPAFLQMRVGPGPGPGAVLTIRLPNGVRVEVPEGATPATVRGVLDALMAPRLPSGHSASSGTSNSRKRRRVR